MKGGGGQDNLGNGTGRGKWDLGLVGKGWAKGHIGTLMDDEV